VRRGRIVAALAAVLLLAGCAEIPKAGPVGNGPTQIPDEPTIVFLPNPPSPGAKPEEIVSGFVQAGAGNNFSVARQYLTKSFAAQWRPTASVLIHDKALNVVQQDKQTIELDVPTVARVAPDGTYTPSVQMQKLGFRLQQVGGQWRIAQAPDGIVLAQTVFERRFKPETLQFFDPGYRRLVPDVRWFTTRSKPTGSVVRALLAGPAGPLQGGVTTTAFPDGTKLESAALAADGSTTIVLTVPGRDPSKQVTDRMQQQLIRSLQPSGALRLLVNGRQAPAAPELQVQGPAQVPVVYAGGRFGTAQSTGAVSEDSVLGKRIAALRPIAVTVSAGQRLAAVQSGDSRVAVVTPDATRVVDRRPGLIDPTLDQLGWTYSVQKDDPTGLMAFSKDGHGGDRPVADLGGSRVIAIEASPDGTRMLVLAQRATGEWEAYVAGIERDATGAPTGLTTDQYPIDVPSSPAIDATWVDDSHVAILTGGTDGSDTVTTQQLGGLSTPAGRLSNAISIVGTSSKSDLRARDNTGNVLEPSGNVWQNVFPATVDVAVLAVQR
jgi:hypothetical protein